MAVPAQRGSIGVDICLNISIGIGMSIDIDLNYCIQIPPPKTKVQKTPGIDAYGATVADGTYIGI